MPACDKGLGDHVSFYNLDERLRGDGGKVGRCGRNLSIGRVLGETSLQFRRRPFLHRALACSAPKISELLDYVVRWQSCNVCILRAACAIRSMAETASRYVRLTAARDNLGH